MRAAVTQHPGLPLIYTTSKMLGQTFIMQDTLWYNQELLLYARINLLFKCGRAVP